MKMNPEAMMRRMKVHPRTAPGSTRLKELPAPRTNPGNLRGLCYVPAGISRPMALVVVLHGCTQTAALYDEGSGWSRLADRHGFALLFPEQQRANNPNLCFNWFQAADMRRGGGEAASIRAMIDQMADLHPIDRSRIFVTGLSAGGAMASVMLAAYPETFAAGAIIAGLPYGCSSGVNKALEWMAGRGHDTPVEASERIRKASSHPGPWPRVSVWHGGADTIVSPGNADRIVGQWLKIHGLPDRPARVDKVDGHARRSWVGPDGETIVEHYSISGMGHGVPLSPGTRDGRSGTAGAHMLDVGISSTDRIAGFFGLTGAVRAEAAAKSAPQAGQSRVLEPIGRVAQGQSPQPRQPEKANGVADVIEDALRAAGLMR